MNPPTDPGKQQATCLQQGDPVSGIGRVAPRYDSIIDVDDG